MTLNYVTKMKHELNANKSIWTRIAELRQNDIDLLAPKFAEAVTKSLADLKGRHVKIGALEIPLDVVVFETARSNELQQIYFMQGTSNARTAEHSWHFYGLAIDVISRRFEWFGNAEAKKVWPDEVSRFAAAEKWFMTVGGFFEVHGCKLGAKWKRQDLPHIQWGNMPDSPNKAPEIYRTKGLEAVWRTVKAI